MKEKLLARIFALARQSPEAEETAIPFGLETSVLAHWREARAGMIERVALLRRLRWAAVMAVMLTMGAAVWQKEDLSHFSERFNPENRIADSATSAWFADE